MSLYFPYTVRLGCQSADLGFLLDVSGTMESRVYRKSIRIIQALVREFNVRLGRSRAGLVTFSTEAKTEFDFDMYPNAHKFNAALRKLPFKGNSYQCYYYDYLKFYYYYYYYY